MNPKHETYSYRQPQTAFISKSCSLDLAFIDRYIVNTWLYIKSPQNVWLGSKRREGKNLHLNWKLYETMLNIELVNHTIQATVYKKGGTYMIIL